MRSGRNLVVQGPPGTGKSQTITNIIAAAAHDGKTVLFIAEKMAALKVVYDRLVKVGLRELCLELHSRTANKKAFYEELRRTIHAGCALPQTSSDPEALTDARDRLNAIDNTLHETLEEKDYSPFDVIAELCRFLGQKVPPPKLCSEGLAKLTSMHRDEISEAVRAFAEALDVAGPPAEHPFFGTRALDLQPTDVERLKLELSEARDSVERLLRTAETLAQRLGVDAPLDLATTERLAQYVESVTRAPENVRERGRVRSMCSIRLVAIDRPWQSAHGRARAVQKVEGRPGRGGTQVCGCRLGIPELRSSDCILQPGCAQSWRAISASTAVHRNSSQRFSTEICHVRRRIVLC